MEPQGCVAMESQVRSQREGWVTCLSVSNPWRVGIVGSQQNCRVLKGSPCPQPQGKFQFSVCSLKEEKNKPKNKQSNKQTFQNEKLLIYVWV